jgi:hypothetical protein
VEIDLKKINTIQQSQVPRSIENFEFKHHQRNDSLPVTALFHTDDEHGMQ